MNGLLLPTKENTISSLEVAEMVEKQHKELLRDIRTYVEYLKQANEEMEESGERKIALTDFFIESTYVSEQNKVLPCYDITRKGCEYIATKLTGTKGAIFTARFISRFHDMEDYIRQNSGNAEIEQGVRIVKFIADDLNVNTASRLLMYKNYCKDVGIPTGFLPKYEHNGSRELKALSTLLKDNNCNISAVKFNPMLIEQGYLEEKERPSNKKDETKKFKALTENGLKYGENAINPHNQKEVQPLYYSDTFMELYEKVTSNTD